MARWDQDDSRKSIPDWFFRAIETDYVTDRVEVDDCDVVFQRWGERHKPSVLLIHGMHAHSHWWDFIAPQLLPDYQVAAINLTGMGDSDYRYQYRVETFAEEIKAVCDYCKFDQQVALVAHSFGGNVAIKSANIYPDRFGSVILLDSGLRHPDESIPERPDMGGRRAKIYPDKKTALGRFRLQPPQDCSNLYILEYIARNSLMQIEGGWAWKFDEDLLESMADIERSTADYENLTLPVGLIYGENSELFSSRSEEYMRTLVGEDLVATALKDAQHHLFLDQPITFLQELKKILIQLRNL